MVLVFTQVWGYAKVWVLGRFWLRLGPRFGGAADPGFTPRSRGFVANPGPPPGSFIFLFSPIRGHGQLHAADCHGRCGVRVPRSRASAAAPCLRAARGAAHHATRCGGRSPADDADNDRHGASRRSVKPPPVKPPPVLVWRGFPRARTGDAGAGGEPDALGVRAPPLRLFSIANCVVRTGGASLLLCGARRWRLVSPSGTATRSAARRRAGASGSRGGRGRGSRRPQ